MEPSRSNRGFIRASMTRSIGLLNYFPQQEALPFHVRYLLVNAAELQDLDKQIFEAVSDVVLQYELTPAEGYRQNINHIAAHAESMSPSAASVHSRR